MPEQKLDPRDDPTSLGNILVELGFCELDDILGAAVELDKMRAEFLKEMDRMRDMRLGELLIEQGKITREELVVALAKQDARRNGGRVSHDAVVRVIDCAVSANKRVDDAVDQLTQAATAMLAKAQGG